MTSHNKLGLKFSEFSHSAMGTGTPCVQRHVFDRHCMFGPLVVVAVLQSLGRFFFRVVIKHPCRIQSRIKDSG